VLLHKVFGILYNFQPDFQTVFCERLYPFL
jgi:hypothetical protein